MEGQQTPAEVGRDYERFIGYLYETAGWNVVYRGILRGMADRGRDLVCWSGSKVHIVQCKRWSAANPIKAEIVHDLIKTTAEYVAKKHSDDQLGFEWPEAASKSVRAVLFTTGILQSDAAAVARLNRVIIRDRYAFKAYPKIKCHHTSLGKKVYLTPACYSYDSISVRSLRGDCYVYSETEALSLGFEKHEENMALFAAKKRTIRSGDEFKPDQTPSFLFRLKAWLFGLKHGL
ncbi:MAG: restriction endonuclease [Verrucomicrobiaceae bacterium]|nr:restriction endonuclease [Verrucomicrobiaceae bacterium]